ncbi:hypothetical protein DTO013E5_2212 [Penicillium roqueforti]|uniref:Genomic scaffold, ProqFM164S02 n=1 Tax=Penicillium roqueforti (strain FM164) TaxID=1365484 RepID=W6Q4D9_PENRF|nr:uncharacterized protein LCP9604111_1241 [Penicillium roqueforti]CDM31493.1 unnamed protein product [Penicillium roqueforti FM164]KAF9253715.1 hypothetical protein LCP9604111_1241 [Penicillium roqueforti]KAI1829924.1 hypothetical protein CBS147337_9303 [Penicillium roqueforti]KAI2686269.1 hypothetical protein CBS147355_1756 [Penicillium roqueforti]KAI2687411.1 hypothetical protein LCP963914a_4012 [Penicillium roqueforti]
MFASLLRPKRQRGQVEQSPFSTPSPWFRSTHNNSRRVPRADESSDDAPELHEIDEEDMDQDWEEGEEEEDGPLESTPLLPMFSASHLDALPVYNITHAIRPLIASRCETTLTWDQLRSPQVSQFLIKPILQKIMSAHFSRATLYALMANCLQFEREIHLSPGNSGANQTRAMVSELLAIKLLREYSTRELIDALSYEFYPLQGQDQSTILVTGPHRKRVVAARVSCLEVAIRAQAKRFLAHPVVVQQLEAIWAGTVVFHSAADSLHRSMSMNQGGNLDYGATMDPNDDNTTESSNKILRRSVTIYNPRDASLFKLSRLRVPRYRQFLSTLSFAVLLGLFLAVLEQRSRRITSLEILFWFWSAGFMLDEVVGFNEQGFSLYLMSFWNLFDVGILLLLFAYYCLRIYGTFLTYPRSEYIADQAFDVLTATAPLLFPRLFSILDHYRYFSQLLIAFRIMASDLIAVFVLIVISCSGFFVSFLYFGDNKSPKVVAYGLFQMLMGFTPTAWAMWDEYNFLGRTILTVFLFICHFVVVTILITVLTNSFMRIVQNANEEHQFLFAVNTISMVKSDALFSYVAPTNIIAWLVTPFRSLMPFRDFIRLNRTIIKITHLPILFTICLYEKTILSSRVVQPMDLIEPTSQNETPAHIQQPRRFRGFSTSASVLRREPSVATYQKDRALEEVFRRPYRGDRMRGPPSTVHERQTNNVIKDWMQEIGSGPANGPDDVDSLVADRHGMHRQRFKFPFRARLSNPPRDFTETTRSVASNPEDRTSCAASPVIRSRRTRPSISPTQKRQLSLHTDMEGDDELTSNDGDSNDNKQSALGSTGETADSVEGAERPSPKFYSSRPSTARMMSRRNSPTRRIRHTRNASGVTMLYNPVGSLDEETEGRVTPTRPDTDSSDGESPPFASTSLDQGTMKRHDISRARNPPIGLHMSVPDIDYLTNRSTGTRPRSSLLYDLGSDLGDNKAVASGFSGALPSSFQTQLGFAPPVRREPPTQTQDMLSKLVLARMNNIEEGFREVIKEFKDLRRSESSRSPSRPDESRGATREKKKRDKKDSKKKSVASPASRAASGEDPFTGNQPGDDTLPSS